MKLLRLYSATNHKGVINIAYECIDNFVLTIYELPTVGRVLDVSGLRMKDLEAFIGRGVRVLIPVGRTNETT